MAPISNILDLTICNRVEDTEDEEEVIESSQLPVDPNAIKKRMEMSVILNTGYDRLPCLSGSVSLLA